MCVQTKLSEELRALIPYIQIIFVCSKKHLNQDPDTINSARGSKNNTILTALLIM